MKKQIIVTTLVVLGLVGLAQAHTQAQQGELHGAVGATYDTKYVWRGYTVFGQKSGIHPFVDLDLFGTGFGLSVAGNRANSSGYEEAERWDYTLNYAGAVEVEQTYETRYMVGYRYFNYPDLSSHTAFKNMAHPGSVDLQEVFAGVGFPRLLGVPGLVPGYAIVKGWPSNSDTVVGAGNPNGGTYSGFAHIFMLDYALPLQNVLPDVPEQVLNFHLETVYNDGVDPRPLGGYTDSDWTHVMAGVTTDFDLGNNVIFTPGLYYQITMEDNGNELIPGEPTSTRGVSPDHDIVWASATLKYKF